MSGRVFLVAAESSGDALGADLARALKIRDAAIELAGVGGPLMSAAGVPSRADISGLAILGFIDGLLAYERVKRAVAEAVTAVLDAKPDVVVLIDSWGFTLRVAQGVRAVDPSIKLVKYIGPQVWATRAGRAKTLAASVDHLICIHDFETPYYEPYGLPCTVCGHPAFGRFKPGDAVAFRARHNVASNQRLLLVLPGSRPAEIRRIGPTLWKTAQLLRADRFDLRFAMVAAQAVHDEAVAQAPAEALIVEEAEKEDAFAAATVALAASGTVTTEVALQGAPLVIGYKLGWLTALIAQYFLFKAKYATLMNVAADAEVAPEFLQYNMTPENLARAAAPLLDDPAARADQIARQNRALDRMGRGGRPASEIAADVVVNFLATKRQSESFRASGVRPGTQGS
ncbi:MAG: lipid-A-disaccharide synthase [Proteobacteria bacterium]|nr:lipid-A-disaccharide synthase [Pseudomonadota bacterium]